MSDKPNQFLETKEHKSNAAALPALVGQTGASTGQMGRRLQQIGIRTRLTALILVITVPLLVGIAAFISTQAGKRIEADANKDLQQNNVALANSISTWLELSINTLEEMVLLPDIVSMQAEQQRLVLQAVAEAHPYMYLVSTTDLTGMNVARSDEAALTDYSDRLWFRNARAGAPITFQSLISRTTARPALVVSMPILDENGAIVGVGMFAADLTTLSEQTRVHAIGQTGYVYVVDADDMLLAHPDPAYTTGELRDFSAYPPVVALRQGQTGLFTFTDKNGVAWRAYVGTLDNGWGVIAQQPEAEILAPVRQFQTIAYSAIAIGAVVMLVLSWFTIRRTLRPIDTLTEAASAIAAGDLERVVEVKSRDELGVLASVFNHMTSQLRGLIGNLEQRVQAATRNLVLAAEVGRKVSQEHDLDILLKDAVERIREQFDLYYTQVYLLDPSGQRLVLRAGTGLVGQQLLAQHHSLAVDLASLNGAAVSEKRAIIVEDTQTSAIFRPNPLLPNTRSEMVVPLMIGERVVGVLDMQSEQPGSLSSENLPAFETLAGQLAIAIESAALLAEANEARAQLEAQSRRLIRSGWREFLDGIERHERIGYRYEQDKIVPFAEPIQVGPAEGALVAPIPVANEPVGLFKFEGKDTWSEAEAELVNDVARLLGRQVENLRLIAQAEQYRAHAEGVVRRLTYEGWTSQLAAEGQSELGFIYDLDTVTPLPADGNGEAPDTVQPLEVMGVKIGELAVAGADGVPEEDIKELLAAVSDQLAARVENLRLAEQTQKRAQREQALRKITSAVRGSIDPAIILRSAVRELGTLLGRKTVIRLETDHEEQAGQPDRSTDLAEGPATTYGNEPVSPVESPNTAGGDKTSSPADHP